ncbi:glycosyltransferase [Patescibacteria group bacterium]|nr:glycosyltransferase [Patescibacteria group bacterium]MBU1472163.1 glycosyltransferase [Patescibacteria group bacterium]MBU2459557.1 glycosyltransferase [Patescibacteria group bacterium]MBU2544202.1 glycosyltransferase [Patescibacteria group bacterium]
MITISVIIPTVYMKHPKALFRAICSIKQAATADISYWVTVIANDVPIRVSAETIANDIHRKTHIAAEALVSHVNKGFAPAVNDGIVYERARRDPDWYFVLNDDACVHKGFFVSLLSKLGSDRYDVVSCKIIAPGGEIESVGLNYNKTGVALPRRRDAIPKDASIFSGTCVLLYKNRVKKELKKHGYVFNPLFFAYSEDLELSLRIHKDGGKIYISNEPLVTHLGSQTAGRGSYFQLYHSYRNWLLVVLLHWPLIKIIINIPPLLLGQLYIFGMTLYKRHLLVYPKALWFVVRNMRIILYQRKHYSDK